MSVSHDVSLGLNVAVSYFHMIIINQIAMYSWVVPGNTSVSHVRWQLPSAHVNTNQTSFEGVVLKSRRTENGRLGEDRGCVALTYIKFLARSCRDEYAWVVRRGLTRKDPHTVM